MEIINKELFKKFINGEKSHRFRINEIHEIKIKYRRWLYENIPDGSMYKKLAEPTGFANVKMIFPVWDGWRINLKTNDYFIYKKNINIDLFSYELYVKWKRKYNLKELLNNND